MQYLNYKFFLNFTMLCVCCCRVFGKICDADNDDDNDEDD